MNDPLSVATGELATGERLIWADRPDPARTARRRWPAVLFGLLFTGFAVVWTIQAIAVSTPMALVGAAFVALGVGVLIMGAGRRRDRWTTYAITDRRLLIIRDGTSRRVRSFQPADILTLERRERPDGSGDLIFRQETVRRDDLRLRRDGPPYLRSRRSEVGFFGIANVKRVEAAVRALRERRDPGEP